MQRLGSTVHAVAYTLLLCCMSDEEVWLTWLDWAGHGDQEDEQMQTHSAREREVHVHVHEKGLSQVS